MSLHGLASTVGVEDNSEKDYSQPALNIERKNGQHRDSNT